MNPIGVISMSYARPFTAANFSLFERMRRAGMDFVELLVPEEGELDPAAAGSAARDAGLGVVLAARVNLQRDLASDDPASHAAGVAYLKRCAEVALAMGAKIVGGPLYGAPLVFAGRAPAPIDEERRLARVDRVIGGLHEAGEHAHARGVRLAIEPLNRFETDFCNTARQAVELAQAADSRGVGIMLDTFHMNMGRITFHSRSGRRESTSCISRRTRTTGDSSAPGTSTGRRSAARWQRFRIRVRSRWSRSAAPTTGCRSRSRNGAHPIATRTPILRTRRRCCAVACTPYGDSDSRQHDLD